MIYKKISSTSIQYRLYFYALSLIFTKIPPINASQEIVDCPFIDTVNITDSERLGNGSYLFNNIVIPPDLIGLYDYDIIEDGQTISVPLHLRGCVCRLKPCVKFCCHPREIKLDLSLECSRELGEDLQYSPLLNITLVNGESRMMHVLDEFVVQQGIPCKDHYVLTPQLQDYDDWQLFENGTLLRLDDMALLNKLEYCLTPTEINGSYILNPVNCAIVAERSLSKTINIVAMIVSIPFLLVTIFVYAAIPELRNLHGKCLICHLIALTLGNIMLIAISLEDVGEVMSPYSLETCRTLGYIGCYCFMAAFFWLSMISFDLWQNLHSVRNVRNRLQQRKRFFLYSLYAWGLPLIVSVLTIIAQNSNMDDSLKPGFGVDYCWFNDTLWSPMLYFYGPVLLLMLFNLTMFVLTASQIRRVQKDLTRVIAEDESSKHWRCQRNNFGLYLRLFIVMGVSWLVEVISYMVGPKNIWTSFLWITDFCNCAQGIIIFILFVLKKKVRKLLSKRMRFKTKPSSHSNTTQSDLASEEEMSLKEMNQQTQTH